MEAGAGGRRRGCFSSGMAAERPAAADLGERLAAAAEPQRLAARLGRAATYRAQGWRERTKGMLDLVAVVGDDAGGGRSGRRRRQYARVAMVAFPRVALTSPLIRNRSMSSLSCKKKKFKLQKKSSTY